MKRISFMTILFSLLTATAFAKTMTSNAVFMEAKDIKWQAIEGFTGVQMATVEGDATKGPNHSFAKFEPGFSAPMHHHTADHFGTVITGTVIFTVDGVEHRLTPGSFFSFKKKQSHVTTCAPGAECMISLDTRGKWDIVPQKKLVKSH